MPERLKCVQGQNCLYQAPKDERTALVLKSKFEFSGVLVSIDMLVNSLEARFDALFLLFLVGRRGLDLSDGQGGEENASGRSVFHKVAVEGFGGIFAKISFDNGFSAGMFR